MAKLNCIIVEDEPLAAEILQDYIKEFPLLELKGVSGHVMDAIEILKQHRIDVIFLDIHLPKIRGLDFIKTLTAPPPMVVVTSAHQQYAIDGYALNVVDYLLKPIEFDRFMMAINKITARGLDFSSHHTEERPHLFFNVSKQRVRIYTDEILYIESLREYVKIVSSTKTIVTKLLLTEIEQMLMSENFIRVHRSFIVAKSKVDAVSATEVQISSRQIPIGRSYKDHVLLKFPSAN